MDGIARADHLVHARDDVHLDSEIRTAPGELDELVARGARERDDDALDPVRTDDVLEPGRAAEKRRNPVGRGVERVVVEEADELQPVLGAARELRRDACADAAGADDERRLAVTG